MTTKTNGSAPAEAAWHRAGHTMRFRNDLWAEVEEAGQRSATDFTTRALEAMLGCIRCPSCPENAAPVPAEFGNLEGRPLRDWVAGAVKQARAQHPAHSKIRVGWDGEKAPPVAAGPDLAAEVAKLRAEVDDLRARIPARAVFKPAETS